MAKKKDDNVYDEEDILDEDIEYETPEHEDIELEMHVGTRDVDVYSEEGLEEELDHDELAPWEQGFMEGEIDGGRLGECDTCGKLITDDMEEVYEREINNTRKLFCSKRCLNNAEE